MKSGVSKFHQGLFIGFHQCAASGWDLVGRDHHGSVACSMPSSGYAHQETEWDEHFQVRAEGNHDPSAAAFHVREENYGSSVTAFQMRAEGNQSVRWCAVYQKDMFFFKIHSKMIHYRWDPHVHVFIKLGTKKSKIFWTNPKYRCYMTLLQFVQNEFILQ